MINILNKGPYWPLGKGRGVGEGWEKDVRVFGGPLIIYQKKLYGLESNSQNLDFDGFLKKKSSSRARSDRKKYKEEILYNMTLSLQNFLHYFHCLIGLFIFSHFRNSGPAEILFSEFFKKMK